MNGKRIISFLLAVCLLFSVTACNSSKDEIVETGAENVIENAVEKEEPVELDDVKLRDKKLLYENQDPEKVTTMYLTVYTGNAPENTDHTWTEINTYSVYDYDRMGVDRYKVAGLLQVGDENGPVGGQLGYGQVSPNCTVQIRGQTSSKLPQKNYKISVKDNQGDWNGQTTIALNKHYSDGLRFRNKLAYDLMAGIDEMMSLRTSFVHLYVKDMTQGGNGRFVDYGLYTQVEQLNRTALKTHGLNQDGHLYKINLCEFYRYEDVIMLESHPNYDLKKFEQILEVKGNSDHSKLIEMLTKVNDYTVPMDEVLDNYFDIENMSYWMAFHILIGNKDTQNRNFYIYSPLNSSKWYFYSWDNDGSMKKEENKLHKRAEGGGWEKGISNYWGNVLFQRALKTEKYRKALDAAIEDIYSYLTPQRVQGMVETYKSVVKPYVFSMPDVANINLTRADYDRVAGSIVQEIRENYMDYKDSYEKPMPFYIGVPEKTAKGLVYRWDPAYDFDAEDITYTFEVARDYTFQNIVLKRDNLVIPEVTGNILPEGQYFIRVIAKNKSGQTQYAFDYYIIESGKVYGTKCFYVQKDGTIVEDVYVEG